VRYLFFLVLLLYTCQSTNEKFEIDNCYQSKSKKELSSKEIIKDLVLKNYKKAEEVFVIEISSPTFHSALLFSAQKRERSIKINFYNNRMDLINQDGMKTINNINIINFINLISLDNQRENSVSKFIGYRYYKFKNHQLIETNSRINYRMIDSLVEKNGLKNIYDLIKSYDDKRDPC